MLKTSKFLLATVLTATLVACGGGGSDSGPTSTLTTTSNLAQSVAAKEANAVVNTPFAFPTGVLGFGTTAPTTLAFTSTSATPSFSIASGVSTATGTTTFGSCIFTIVTSNFPSTSPLAVGQTIIINPCTLNVATAGGRADGSTTTRSVRMTLGTAVSGPVETLVTLNANGTVVINNQTVGTVTVSAVTGN